MTETEPREVIFVLVHFVFLIVGGGSLGVGIYFLATNNRWYVLCFFVASLGLGPIVARLYHVPVPYRKGYSRNRSGTEGAEAPDGGFVEDQVWGHDRRFDLFWEFLRNRTWRDYFGSGASMAATFLAALSVAAELFVL